MIDHQRAMEILGRALERPTEARAAFLDQACEGDPELHHELESLLAAHDAASGFLDKPPLEAPAPATVTEGERIGAYRIVSLIGTGGMGAVYRAVRADEEYQQQVAIKIIKRGMDTDFVISRFRNERQILARLEHPNIARLLDGGTTGDGRPYFVMEYIDGTPITEHCAGTDMPIRERLELFRHVCDAVQYAHQHLIVHRDLKPGNVLVTRECTAKLLDFGIAKLLQPGHEGDPTTLMLRPMTPEYASPEQVRGQPVTTATDVYQLGLLLFELLTGQRAYGTKHAGELERAILECEAPRPSAVAGRRISEDLDNIVRRALEKEPRHRYGSAGEFSEDVRRHLQGLPIAARASTFGYRVSKFVRRNRVPVVAASLLCLTLFAGIMGVLWQARLANQQRLRAERRFSDVRSLAHSFLFQFHGAIAQLPGATPARELVVKTALRYLESLAQESQGDSALQRELAEAYEQVGEIQGLPGAFNLGDTRGALDSYRKAAALHEALAREDPASAQAQRNLASNCIATGRILVTMGQRQEPLTLFRRAVAIAEKLKGADPKDPQNLELLASAYRNLTVGLNLAGRAPSNDALERQAAAVRICEELVAIEPSAPRRRKLAEAYKLLGSGRLELGAPGALEPVLKAVAIDETLVAEQPGSATARMELSESYTLAANVSRKEKHHAVALAYVTKSLGIREVLAASDPRNARIRASVASSHYLKSRILLDGGDAAGALKHAQTAAEMRNTEVRADPDNASNLTWLAHAEETLGDSYARASKCSSALPHYYEALKIYGDLTKSGRLPAYRAQEPVEIARKAEGCKHNRASRLPEVRIAPR